MVEAVLVEPSTVEGPTLQPRLASGRENDAQPLSEDRCLARHVSPHALIAVDMWRRIRPDHRGPGLDDPPPLDEPDLVVEVGFRPGVTDPVATHLFQRAYSLEVDSIDAVTTATRYAFVMRRFARHKANTLQTVKKPSKPIVGGRSWRT